MPDALTRINNDLSVPALRRRLLTNGYVPIPEQGKRPTWPTWQSREITDAVLTIIEEQCDGFTNTGLRTGDDNSGTAVPIVGLDNDAEGDLGAAFDEERVRILGPSPLQRIGRREPGLHVYRLDGGLPFKTIYISERVPDPERPGKTTRKILFEILGQGRQFVAFGRHPDGEHVYRWPNDWDGGSPLETPARDLPAVAVERLRELADGLVQRARALGLDASHNLMEHEQKLKSGAQGDPVTASMLGEMLRHVDPGLPMSDWIAVGAALHKADVVTLNGGPDPDFDAEALFCEWSRGDLDPKKEQPANYCGSDEDCGYRFASIDHREDGAGLGTIVKLARDGGYTGSAHISLLDRNDAVSSLREPANGAADLDESDLPDDGGAPKPAVEKRDDGLLPGYHEWELDSIPDPAYLIEHVIGADELVYLYGDSGNLKSFVALRMMVCGAAVIPFGSSEEHKVTRKLRSVYVCGEGQRGIKKRLKAAKRHFGLSDSDRLDIFVITKLDALASSGKLDLLLDTIRKRFGQVDFMIVDTAARAGAGLDLGRPADAVILEAVFRRIMDELHCSLVAIGHTGKDVARGLAGARQQYANADRVIFCEFARGADGTPGAYGTVALMDEKERDDATGGTIVFRASEIVIDPGVALMDASPDRPVRKPVTSLVLDFVSSSSAPGKRPDAGSGRAAGMPGGGREGADANALRRDVGTALARLPAGGLYSTDVLRSELEEMYQAPGGQWEGFNAFAVATAQENLRKRLNKGTHERPGRGGKVVPAPLAAFCAVPYVSGGAMLWRLPESAQRADEVPTEFDASNP
jgi:hypothetical protein